MVYPLHWDDDICKYIIGDKTVLLRLVEVGNRSDEERLYPLTYPNTDCFLITFSIDMPTSLESINKWYQQVSFYVPGASFILCANKIDLRDSTVVIQTLTEKGLKLVTKEEGENIAKLLKIPYMECSSINNEGIQEIIEAAILISTEHQQKLLKKQSSKCILL